MRAVSILFALYVFISCKNKSATEKDMKNNMGEPQPADSLKNGIPGQVNFNGCYIKISNRDTSIIQLSQTGDGVSGKLVFDNYQMDGSRGTVNGSVEGDIVKLYYDFTAEGMHSVMEIYFKKIDERLLRGIGPVDVKGDTVYFKKPDEITFDEGQVFQKKDCSLVPEKYRE